MNCTRGRGVFVQRVRPGPFQGRPRARLLKRSSPCLVACRNYGLFAIVMLYVLDVRVVGFGCLSNSIHPTNAEDYTWEYYRDERLLGSPSQSRSPLDSWQWQQLSSREVKLTTPKVHPKHTDLCRLSGSALPRLVTIANANIASAAWDTDRILW